MELKKNVQIVIRTELADELAQFIRWYGICWHSDKPVTILYYTK